ncbi:MAG: NB-ARC domain-containing protein [Chloroflexota bacterium]
MGNANTSENRNAESVWGDLFSKKVVEIKDRSSQRIKSIYDEVSVKVNEYYVEGQGSLVSEDTVKKWRFGRTDGKHRPVEMWQRRGLIEYLKEKSILEGDELKNWLELLDLSSIDVAPIQYIRGAEPLVGRGDIADELEQQLLNPGQQAVTLVGPAGVGKTAVAAEVIHRLTPKGVLPDKFKDGIIYHSFQEFETVDSFFRHVARSFRVEPGDIPKEAALDAASNKNTLFILDGTESLEKLGSVMTVVGPCTVLKISRILNDNDPNPLQLKPLSKSDSLELLKLIAHRDELWQEIPDGLLEDRLFKLLGGLPLAVTLAGGFIANSKRTILWCLAMLEKHMSALLERDSESKTSTIISATIDSLSKQQQDVLAVLGFLDYREYSEGMLLACFKDVNVDYYQTINDIHKKLLVEINDNSETVKLAHSLIQDVGSRMLNPPVNCVKNLGLYYLENTVDLYLERENILKVVAYLYHESYWAEVYNLVDKHDVLYFQIGYFVELEKLLQFGDEAAGKLKRPPKPNHKKRVKCNPQIFVHGFGNFYHDKFVSSREQGYLVKEKFVESLIYDLSDCKELITWIQHHLNEINSIDFMDFMQFYTATRRLSSLADFPVDIDNLLMEFKIGVDKVKQVVSWLPIKSSKKDLTELTRTGFSVVYLFERFEVELSHQEQLSLEISLDPVDIPYYSGAVQDPIIFNNMRFLYEITSSLTDLQAFLEFTLPSSLLLHHQR